MLRLDVTLRPARRAPRARQRNWRVDAVRARCRWFSATAASPHAPPSSPRERRRRPRRMSSLRCDSISEPARTAAAGLVNARRRALSRLHRAPGRDRGWSGRRLAGCAPSSSRPERAIREHSECRAGLCAVGRRLAPAQAGCVMAWRRGRRHLRLNPTPLPAGDGALVPLAACGSGSRRSAILAS